MFVNIAYLREGRLYRAERRLGVAAASRTLNVAVTAQQAVSRPRDPGVFDVTVTDQAGQPVRAQVSLAVIDEAVYGVKADDTPDPIRFFYRREYSRVGTTFSSSYYFTGYSGRDRLQLTRAQAAAVHARRLQGRSAGRRRRSARSSPTRSTGSAIS